jgi:hypothetical protein
MAFLLRLESAMFIRKHAKYLGFVPTAVSPLFKRIFQNAT